MARRTLPVLAATLVAAAAIAWLAWRPAAGSPPIIVGDAVASADGAPGPELLRAHVPMLMHPAPRDVALIAVSDRTRHAVATHPDVFIVAADTLKDAPGPYDVIIGVPANDPAGFAEAFKRLRPGGVLAVRVDLARVGVPAVRAVVAALQSIFTEVTAWKITRTELLLVAFAGPLHVDHAAVAARMRDDAVQASLATLSMERVRHLLGFLFAEGDVAEAFGEPGETTFLATAVTPAARADRIERLESWRGVGLEFLQGDDSRRPKTIEMTRNAVEARGLIDLASVHWSRGEVAEMTRLFEQAFQRAPSDPWVREWPAVLMADATGFINAGDPSRAIQAYDAVLAVHRDHLPAQLGRTRAMLLDGRATEAVKELQRLALKGNDWDEPMALAAWVLATHPDDAVRDGVSAVQLAERAAFIGRMKSCVAVDALAAAYAEAGRFDEAITTAGLALQLAEEAGLDRATRIRQRIDGYKGGQPYRDPSGGVDPR